MNILITGGAGFIGAHLAKKLICQGNHVTLLDNLSEQVHGPEAQFPANLLNTARCVRGDICDRDVLAREIDGKEVIVHLAAETGTGQSMYAVQRYGRVNLQGTATLLDLIVNQRPKDLRKIAVASSRAVYGEGKYLCLSHGVVYPHARTDEAMSAGRFEPECPECGLVVQVLPTSEDAPLAPSSFYGLTKQVQEQMVLMFAASLRLDAVALRYQNVYGPGQSLNNPYTGLLAVFSNLVRQSKPLNIFEDGLESRDFIYVDDVVDATAACLSPGIHGIHSLNVGSGVRTTVLEVAHAIRSFFHADVPLEITREFRVGDIRHNAADISRIRALTGFQPKWSFVEGLNQFLAWVQTHEATEAGFDRSLAELKQRGLFGGAR
jgi:dTDP-L-rhamnose 4-epimerase